LDCSCAWFSDLTVLIGTVAEESAEEAAMLACPVYVAAVDLSCKTPHISRLIDLLIVIIGTGF